MNALVGVDLDPAHRLGGAANDGIGQRSRLAGERVGAAVVVGIGVDVEQAVAERGRDRGDRGLIAALGDVGIGQEGGHAGGS